MAAATGQAFEAVYPNSGRRTGLQAAHLAVVRAAAMTCEAHLAGAFEGSRELRFEPQTPTAGQFDFALEPGTPTAHVLETLVPILGRAPGESQVTVRGNTHASNGPTFHFVARHWLPLAKRLGLDATLSLRKAGFGPRGEGEVTARIRPAGARAPSGTPLILEARGPLVAVSGLSGATRQKNDAASRMRDAAQAWLWERRRIESSWEQIELSATSSGCFAQVELAFESGRAAFGVLGERQVRPDVAGERLARLGLRFLDGDAALDVRAAEQLALPLALGGQGGRLSVDVVSEELRAAARVAQQFGLKSRVWGRTGGPGGLEIEGA